MSKTRFDKTNYVSINKSNQEFLILIAPQRVIKVNGASRKAFALQTFNKKKNLIFQSSIPFP